MNADFFRLVFLVSVLENVISFRYKERITTKRPTTPYWFDNNDDDYDYDENSSSVNKGTILQIVFGIVFFVTIMIVYCSCGKKLKSIISQPLIQARGTANSDEGINQQPNQPPSYHSANQETYTEDAPSYDTVMRQQRTHIDTDGTTWQNHDPVFLGGGRLGPTNTPTALVASTAMITPTVPVVPTSVIEPTAPEVPPISTNLQSNNDQPTSYYNSNVSSVNQSLPSVPPPRYDDLYLASPPPPPYTEQ
ncbi:hypothetical protein ACF0H5_005370 [Mactra antiquata]